MSGDTGRRSSGSGNGRGVAVPAVVPPQIVSDRSILDSAIGFINEVTLAHQPHSDPKDTITWARFETAADISDPRFGEDWEVDGNVAPPLLLILGYGLGVQVWAIPANGEAVEVLSWRHGIVSTLRVLPTPVNTKKQQQTDDFHIRAEEQHDQYADKRPLIALVDGSATTSGAHPQFCAVNFVSLRTGQQVKTIKFKNPVLDVLANRSSIAVTFHERIAVFDALTFEDRLSITTCYPSPGINPNPVALGPRWLAYAEHRLLHSKRSGGGCDSDGVPSYTATMLNAAKSFSKGLRELGEQVAAGLTGTSGGGSISKNNSIDSNSGSDAKQPGIITIIDIKNPIKDYSPTSSTPSSGQVGNDPIIAHFIAHSDAIVACEFDNSGMILVTADRRGHDFHVFRIQPHPVGSSLAAVHHLYILHRGDTSAKVQNIAFSLDSRWVAISTLRGTTHVFPITPYGGSIGFRTHTSLHVVNKLSRFHRSAGLTADGRSSSPISHSESTTFTQSLHPYHNATMPPYPKPTVLQPLTQLRQPFALGSPPGSAGMAGKPISNTSNSSSQRQRLSSLSDDSGKPLSVCAIFAKTRSWLLDPPNATREAPHRMQRKAVDSLFVMAGHGALIQYDLDVKLASNVAKEKICDDTPIELEVEAKAQWNLVRRKDGSQEIIPPLSLDNWLIKKRSSFALCDESSQQLDDCDDRAESWLAQVEIITHAGPHRRLWMGPQFVFKTYNAPSGSNLSHVDAEAVEIGVAKSATSSTASHQRHVERSSPLNMPLTATGRSAVPVLIESGSYSSIEQSPKLMDRFRHDHLDSDYMHGDSRLKEDLADAMRESPSVSSQTNSGGGRLSGNALSSENIAFYDALTDHDIDDYEQARASSAATSASAAALANVLPNIYSFDPNTRYESLDSLRKVKGSIEKIVNPLGTVTTVTSGMSGEIKTDILDEVVSQLAAEEVVIHENCDESLFRPVVAIYCNENERRRGEEEARRQMELATPPEPIDSKLIVPVIAKELNDALNQKQKQKTKLKQQQKQQQQQHMEQQQKEQQEKPQQEQQTSKIYQNEAAINMKSIQTTTKTTARATNTSTKAPSPEKIPTTTALTSLTAQEEHTNFSAIKEKTAMKLNISSNPATTSKTDQEKTPTTSTVTTTATATATATASMPSKTTALTNTNVKNESTNPNQRSPATIKTPTATTAASVSNEKTTTIRTEEINMKSLTESLREIDNHENVSASKHNNDVLGHEDELKNNDNEVNREENKLNDDLMKKSADLTEETPKQSKQAQVKSRKNSKELELNKGKKDIKKEKEKEKDKEKANEEDKVNNRDENDVESLSSKAEVAGFIDDSASNPKSRKEQNENETPMAVDSTVNTAKSSLETADSTEAPKVLSKRAKKKLKKVSRSESNSETEEIIEIPNKKLEMNQNAEDKNDFEISEKPLNQSTNPFLDPEPSIDSKDVANSALKPHEDKLVSKEPEAGQKKSSKKSKNRRGSSSSESEETTEKAADKSALTKEPIDFAEFGQTKDKLSMDNVQSEDSLKSDLSRVDKTPITVKKDSKSESNSEVEEIVEMPTKTKRNKGKKLSSKGAEPLAKDNLDTEQEIFKKPIDKTPTANELIEENKNKKEESAKINMNLSEKPLNAVDKSKEKLANSELKSLEAKSSKENVEILEYKVKIIEEAPRKVAAKQANKTPLSNENSPKKKPTAKASHLSGKEVVVVAKDNPISNAKAPLVSAWKTMSGADMISKTQEKLLPDIPTPTTTITTTTKTETKTAVDTASASAMTLDNFPALKSTIEALPPLADLEPLEDLSPQLPQQPTKTKTKSPTTTGLIDAESLISFESPLQENPALERKITPPPRGFTERNLIFALCGSLHYENESLHTKIPDDLTKILSQTQSEPKDQEAEEEAETAAQDKEDKNVAKMQKRKKLPKLPLDCEWKQQQQLQQQKKDETVKQILKDPDPEPQQAKNKNERPQKQSPESKQPANPRKASKKSKDDEREEQEQQPPPDDEELRPLIDTDMNDSQYIDPMTSSDHFGRSSSSSSSGRNKQTDDGFVMTTDSEGPMPATTTSDDNNTYSLPSSIFQSTSPPNKIKTKKLDQKFNLMAAIEAATSSSTSSADEEEKDLKLTKGRCSDPDLFHSVNALPIGSNLPMSHSITLASGKNLSSSSSSSSGVAATTTSSSSSSSSKANHHQHQQQHQQQGQLKMKTKRRKR